MPAHVKSSLMGASLDIPISHGRLALGTWQVWRYTNPLRDPVHKSRHLRSSTSRRLLLRNQSQKILDTMCRAVQRHCSEE